MIGHTGFAVGVLGMGRVVGMGRVFMRLFGMLIMRVGLMLMIVVRMRVMRMIVVSMLVMHCRAGRSGSFVRRRSHFGRERRRRCLAVMRMIMLVTFIVVMAQLGRLIRITTDVVNMSLVAVIMVVRLMIMGLRIMRLIGLAVIRARSFDHAALDAIALAATARVAVARAAAVGAIFGFFLGLAMGALIGFDQRLTIGDRNLIIVRMDFAEGQEAMAVAAIFNEGCLQRWLYAGDLGEIDVSAQLLALGSLEVKLFDTIAADHNDPSLFRVGGVDQHFVGHFGTLDGGGRVSRCARVARPGDATVHLIRG
jgi:hypothetical protein